MLQGGSVIRRIEMQAVPLLAKQCGHGCKRENTGRCKGHRHAVTGVLSVGRLYIYDRASENACSLVCKPREKRSHRVGGKFSQMRGNDTPRRLDHELHEESP